MTLATSVTVDPGCALSSVATTWAVTSGGVQTITSSGSVPDWNLAPAPKSIARFNTAGDASSSKTSRPLLLRARPIDVPIRPVPTILIGPVSLESFTGLNPTAGLLRHEDKRAGSHFLGCLTRRSQGPG